MKRVTVSFDEEPLVLVDANDAVLGFDTKINAHRGRGVLHRAFSVFLFDPYGRVLLQQRSAQKPLWPEFWSNSCCSHPRRGESYAFATQRRLQEELGVSAELESLYRFEYHAQFGDIGAEHELCTVFAGCIDETAPVHPNPNEVKDWRWFTTEEMDAWVAGSQTSLTPWCLLEWCELRSTQAQRIDKLISGYARGARAAL